MIVKGIVTLLLLAATMGLSGCTCQPLLEVRSCLPESDLCGPREGDIVIDWTPEQAQRWPQVDELVQRVNVGEHVHANWVGPAEEFWNDHGVAMDGSPELFVNYDENVLRIRILSC